MGNSNNKLNSAISFTRKTNTQTTLCKTLLQCCCAGEETEKMVSTKKVQYQSLPTTEQMIRF